MKIAKFLLWKLKNTGVTNICFGLACLTLWAGLVSAPIFGVYTMLIGILFSIAICIFAGMYCVYDDYKEWLKNENN